MSWVTVSPGQVAVDDLPGFVRRLDDFGDFDRDSEVIAARAPGRLDVMGGIADYSGSLVLQLPLAEAAWVAVQETTAPVLEMVSTPTTPSGQPRRWALPMSAFERDGKPIEYDELRRLFADPADHWAAYFAGVVAVLGREHGLDWRGGARLLIASDVPEGAGVASSAAVEVATMQAICTARQLELEPRALALACQVAENRVAGAACGVMDQITAACGEAGMLLALLCQPAELRDPVPIPDDLQLWGIDSGLRHAIAGADYAAVRVGAFMGYRILAEHLGLSIEATGEGAPLRIEDPRWRGYLANIGPFDFETHLARALPRRMTGREFVRRYGGTTDPTTTIDPESTYEIRTPTAHPVHEHHRVQSFAELLGEAHDEGARLALGDLMHQSHASMSACGLGSDHTDQLVELVRRAGPGSGLYGAKITGGGGGGVVAVLGRRGRDREVERVASEYVRGSGRPARVFRGSSPGAARFGAARFSWQD